MIAGIAMSNIAWDPGDDREVIRLLQRHAVRGVNDHHYGAIPGSP